MTVIASASVNTPSWGGGSLLALRLNPGASRKGTCGLSITLISPKGLEYSSMIRVPLICKAWFIPL